MPQIGANRSARRRASGGSGRAGFCARRPASVPDRLAGLQTFGQKAQYGSKFLYEFLSEHFGETPQVAQGREETGSMHAPAGIR